MGSNGAMKSIGCFFSDLVLRGLDVFGGGGLRSLSTGWGILIRVLCDDPTTSSSPMSCFLTSVTHAFVRAANR